ncbi:MAG: type II toxin-antitoxin system HicB family antitoxin [Anaerolineae bacterium]|nr:type II toxin-antitoxin system HicB family antitoxin [Anaerolineae bacterium]
MPTRQVILHPDETGGYWVDVPSLPGCISQGDTKEEALANIKEAIELMIEGLIEDGDPVPPAHPFLVETVEIGDTEEKTEAEYA